MKARRKANVNRVLVHCAHRSAEQWRRRVAARGRRFLTALELSGVELSIALVSDAAIRRLNREWRRVDRPTDVLSFPAGEAFPGARGPTPLGDIIVSLDTTARAARGFRRPIGDELDRYLAHGLLHLLGHDHQVHQAARRMAAAEALLLGAQGMVPP